MEYKNLINPKIIGKIKRDKRIIALLLFGSYARSEEYRDIDICLVLDKKYPNLEMSRKKLEYASLFPVKFDIQIFQQLPIYIRKRILKEAKIVLCKDDERLYEIAFLTIKEFEFYKKIYHTYLDKVEELG